MSTSVLDTIPIQHHIDITKWWKYRNLRTLNLLLLVPLLTSFTLGFDGSMFGALQASDAWQKYFDHPVGSDLASLGAAPTIASFVAIFLIPFTSDRLGRRWSLFIGCLFIIFGGALQAGAATLGMYGASRAFIGFGSVWCQTSGIAWVVELAHPRQRATATAIFFTSYAIGSVIAAWTVFGTVHMDSDAAWRVPSALQCVPAIVQALFCFVCPDSPRHLYSRGKVEEAKAIITKYHSEGVADELAEWEFAEIRAALDAEKTLTKGYLQPLKEAFKTKGNRKRIFLTCWLAVCSQASGNSFISYYFSPVLRSVGITSELKQTLINATSQILSWASAVAFAFLPSRVGRRPLFLLSLALLLGVVVGMTAASAMYAKDSSNKAASYAVIALVYLFSPSYNLGFNGNFTTYISEINTFHMRLTALALQQFTTNCVQLIFQYATPIGLENIGWKYFLVHVPWIVIEFAVVWIFLPETKGYALEEIAILFDGDQAALHDSVVPPRPNEREGDVESKEASEHQEVISRI